MVIRLAELLMNVSLVGRLTLAEIVSAAAPASITIPVPAANVLAAALIVRVPGPPMVTGVVAAGVPVPVNSRLLTAVTLPSVVVKLAAVVPALAVKTTSVMPLGAIVEVVVPPASVV